VHVGVAGVVRDGLALDAAPGGRADDLARLRLDVAEADLLVFAVERQVGVVRPVCLPSASQALTATWPLVSGASISTTSAASMSDSIFGMPRVTPSA
jgi:hypothetical protein